MRSAGSEVDDRTARARIRDAAVARFAADGGATSVRAVAADAGVSPALVIHHFGSKEALRTACDEYVTTTIRRRKATAMAAGTGLDPLAALRDAAEDVPVLPYLARTMVEGSTHAAALVDELVDDATRYMDDGVESGLLRPTNRPRERAVVLTLWSLGALVLHDHAKRLLGVDLLGPPEELAAYVAPALEILSDGLFTDQAAAKFRDLNAFTIEDKEAAS